MAKDGVEVEIKIPVSKKLFEEIRRFLILLIGIF